ncbi:MAG: urea ABC transporter permease subunit UrtC, partial [Burkholderiales bacterium]|nr:urea ABC transporter permease subunit UrtC [Anaerolineae bacterium]
MVKQQSNSTRTGRIAGFSPHTLIFIACAFVLLVLLPIALSDFQINLLGRFLTYAIVALGLDLLWGYTGMLSLGQGLFFGLGAYCFAMYLNLEAVGDAMPEFMGLYGVTELPGFWQPFHSPVFAILMAMVVPTVLAGVVGFMIFRSRVQGVYFSIITQALTAIVALLLIGQQRLINGTNGITEMRTIFGLRLADHGTKIGLFIATVIVLGLVYLGCRWLVGSRFGRLLVAVRDDENRVRFMGYNTVVIKTLVFMLSAAIAGLAGALFVPQVGIISPKQLDIVASIEIVVWVAFGGRGSLIGAIIGALLVNTGKSAISSSYPDIWQLIMGGLFVGVVLLFPKGLVGSLGDTVRRFKPAWRRLVTARQSDDAALDVETALLSEGG